MGVPLVALYMQSVRVYKYLVGFVYELPSWASSRRHSSGSSMRQSPYWASRPALGLASVGSIHLANPLHGYTLIGIPPSVVPERVVDSTWA